MYISLERVWVVLVCVEYFCCDLISNIGAFFGRILLFRSLKSLDTHILILNTHIGTFLARPG